MQTAQRLTASPLLAGMTRYDAGRPAYPCDLFLDGNEGLLPDALTLGLDRTDPAVVRRYPAVQALQEAIAARYALDPSQVLITAGADDGLDRACRAVLGPGKNLVLPWPSFAMLRRYAQLTGAEVRQVPWLQPSYPLDAVCQAATDDTAAIAVVSPNNPTGAVASAADLRRLSASFPGALLIVDQAYAEFADEDLTACALSLPNAVVLRTLSKAWGLAGLRVGFALGSPEIINWMAVAGQPYPVSSVSLELAARWLHSGDRRVRVFTRQVRRERAVLAARLASWGADPMPSQANFVLARFRDAKDVRDGLAAQGIAVRGFAEDPDLNDFLRITCPGNSAAFARLLLGLEQVLVSPDRRRRKRPAGPKACVEREPQSPSRTARVERETRETQVALSLALDGARRIDVRTGIGFLDHMITSLAFHAGFDLELRCVGDLHVDDHHTAEDTALALGAALREALGDRSGITRFGSAYVPLDEALARTVVDISGRPFAAVNLGLRREQIGGLATENATHWMNSLAMAAGITLHVDVLRGENDHHRVEAAFKSLALALRQAVVRRDTAIASTKGVL